MKVFNVSRTFVRRYVWEVEANNKKEAMAQIDDLEFNDRNLIYEENGKSIKTLAELKEWCHESDDA